MMIAPNATDNGAAATGPQALHRSRMIIILFPMVAAFTVATFAIVVWASEPARSTSTIEDRVKHDPEKLADFSDKIMRPNNEQESAIDSNGSHSSSNAVHFAVMIDRRNSVSDREHVRAHFIWQTLAANGRQ